MKKLLLTFIVFCAFSGLTENLTDITISGKAAKNIPFFIADFDGTSGSQLAQVVRRDLALYGTFAPVNISSSLANQLCNSDKAGKKVNYISWARKGVQLLGKGTISGSHTLTVEFRLYMPQTSRLIMAKRYTASAKSLRRVAHQIADDIIATILKEKGFFTSRLLFVKARNKFKTINICDADGANQKSLTSGNTISTFPAWFPNGKSILFTDFHEGRAIMYKMNFSDGKYKRLLAMPGMNTSGAVSADGTKLAAILDKDGRPELYVFNISSGARVRLTKGRAAESSPSFSPDGRHIAYASDKSGSPQIYIIPAGGGTARSITSRSFSRYCTSPAWSPDGKKIAFVAQLAGNFEICIYDFASKQIYQLTNNPSNDEHPDWAPNSRHLAFCRGGARIMLINYQNAKEATLVQASTKCSNPAWQP